jgi:hypothetical protein
MKGTILYGTRDVRFAEQKAAALQAQANSDRETAKTTAFDAA